MNFTEFQSFFHTHIKQYAPYKDSKIFQMFTSFLSETYFRDSYETVPAIFKEMFETQVIPSEFTTPFLQSLGIPLSAISKLSNSDQFKLITSLSDFHRYKGSIKLIDNLINTFNINDDLAAYELYLNFHTNQSGQRIWDVIPRLITGSKNASLLNSTELFALLDNAPNWMIDQETLNSLYNAGELELPYKTSAVLLDSTIINDLSVIFQLVSSLVLETLKQEKIQLFFSSGVYLTKFDAANALWFYIIQASYNAPINQVSNIGLAALTPIDIFSRYEIPNASGVLARGGSLSLNAPLTSIQSILDEYARVSTQAEIQAFKTNFIDIFPGFSISGSLTFAQYRARVSTIVDSTLLDYVDSRLNSALNRKLEANVILSELHNSFLTYRTIGTQTMDMNYFDYYLLNLPGIVNDIKNSATYILLDFLKPYHSDLITRTNQKTVVHNKFDNGLIAYSSVFSTMFEETSVISMSEMVNTKSLTSVTSAILSIMSEFIFNTVYSGLSKEYITDHLNNPGTIVSYISSSVELVSETIKHSIALSNTDNLPIVISNIVNSKYVLDTIYGQILHIKLFNTLQALADSLHISETNSETIRLNLQESIGAIQKAMLQSMNYLDPIGTTTEVVTENPINSTLQALADSLHISESNSETVRLNLQESIGAIQKAMLQSMNYLDPIGTTTEVVTENPINSTLQALADSLHISETNSIIPKKQIYDNMISTDVAPSYIYDNPITGIHTVYTS